MAYVFLRDSSVAHQEERAVNDPKPPSFWINEEVAEEQLLRQIAYYKARLADIQKAPENSRHREGLATTEYRLEECRQRLAQLRRSQRRLRH